MAISSVVSRRSSAGCSITASVAAALDAGGPATAAAVLLASTAVTLLVSTVVLWTSTVRVDDGPGCGGGGLRAGLGVGAG